MGFRKICRASDERTVITYAFPRAGLGDSGNIMLPRAFEHSPLLYSNSISMALDYVLRQKLGGTNLNFFQFEQLPFISPETMALHADSLTPRILELTYTAYDMSPFARDLGDTGTPFRWDPDRRAIIRAELDALFFHLYGITRDDTAYILDTFNVTRDNDTKAHGEYRTKNLILAEYDRMTTAGLTLETPLTEGESGTYRSTLTPPPARAPATADPPSPKEATPRGTSKPDQQPALNRRPDVGRGLGHTCRRATPGQRSRVPDAPATGGEAQGIAAIAQPDTHGDQRQTLGPGSLHAQPGPRPGQRAALRPDRQGMRATLPAAEEVRGTRHTGSQEGREREGN